MNIKRIASLATVVALSASTLFIPSASASSPHWSNTYNKYGPNPLTVYWCSGGKGVIKPGKKTTKNVCGVKVFHNRQLFVYASATGTTLLDVVNCGPDRRINLTTKTDTSRTAMVSYGVTGDC